MPFDGIVAHAVADELRGLIVGGRIEKIFQTGRDEIVLLCHAGHEHYRLLLSADAALARIHLTRSKKENPLTAPPFAMVLRKHLQGARILSVQQDGFDRVLSLTAEIRSEMGDVEQKKLVLEIMGKYSNIILLNGAGVIHDAIRHVDSAVSRVREIMPARPYTAPPGQDKYAPDVCTRAQLQARWDAASPDKGVSGWILSVLSGFSPLLCDAVCRACPLEPGVPLRALSQAQRTALFDQILAVCAEIRDGTYCPAILDEGRDFHCLEAVCRQAASCRRYNTVNLMLDEFYTQKDRSERLQQKKNAALKTVNNALERVRRRTAIHEDTERENADHEQLRIYGELLTANLYRLPEYAESVAVENFFDAEMPTVVIPLNPARTTAQNAQQYFRRYRRQKNSYDSAQRLHAEDLAELEYLESVRVQLENAAGESEIAEIRQELADEGYGTQQTSRHAAASPSGASDSAPASAFLGGKPASKKSLRARAAKAKACAARSKADHGANAAGRENEGLSKPLSFTTDDGYRILVGRNNRQNDRLTMREAKPDDLWFHLHGAPGSHVILCLAEKNGVPTRAAMEAAASLAAWYSSARGSAKADVDFTRVKYIKKIPGARPGMVIYSEYKTVTVRPRDSV